MKRMLICFLTMLLLALPVCGQCESYNYYLLDSSEAGRLYDVCHLGDELVLLGSTGVWLHQPKTGEMTALLKYNTDLLENPIATDYRSLDHIFVQDGVLYVYDSYTPAFYRVEDHAATPCFEDAAEIFTFDDQGETIHKNFVSGAAAEDGLYLLLNSFTFSDGDVYELCHLNAATGEVTLLGKQSVDVLYSVANGKLLAGKATDDGQGQRLYLYDTATNTLAAMNDQVYNREAVGFVWDEATGMLYYTADSGKVYAEAANGQTGIIAYLPYQFLYSSAKTFLWNNSYVYLQDTTLNIRALDGELDELVTLKILGTVSDSITKEYMAENPQVNIVLDPRESSFLGLQEALLSGDNSIDLFLVESDGIYTEVVEKGYAASLSKSEVLVDRVSAFYPWAQELLIQDGELYAIPVTVTSNYWTINRTKWQELGLGEYPQTYEDLFRIAEVWEDTYAEDYPDYYLFECMDEMPGMVRAIVRQYLLAHEDWSAPVDFNTDEFRTAIQSVLDHPDVFMYDGERMVLIMSYPQYLGTGYNDENLVESFLPPALTADSSRVAGGTMELLVMNPSSAHQEEVMKFMEFYMEHLDAMTTYELDASRTEPLRPDGYQDTMQSLTEQINTLTAKLESVTDPAAKAELTETLETLQRRYARQESNWRFSAEDIAIYQEIAEKIVMPTKTIYPAGSGINAEAFNTVIDQFAAGSMSLETFIRMMNERANVIFLEY